MNNQIVPVPHHANQLARQDDGKFLIDAARVTFRNFQGAQGQYNAAGQRNFHVVLTEEQAAYLKDQGFNVKSRPPREEGGEWFHHLKINVKMDSNIPPKLFIVNSKGRKQLTEDMLISLDWVEFANVDLIFSRYRRDWGDGRITVTAYLQTFFGTVREDELEQRYAGIPDIDSLPQETPESAQDVLVWHESTPLDPAEIEFLKQRELES